MSHCDQEATIKLKTFSVHAESVFVAQVCLEQGGGLEAVPNT